MQTKPRTLETPAAQRLNATEAAEWCAISVDDWRDMVRIGLIPAGAVASVERSWWRWEIVMAVEALLDHFLPRLRAHRAEVVKQKRAKKAGRTGGRPGGTGG